MRSISSGPKQSSNIPLPIITTNLNVYTKKSKSTRAIPKKNSLPELKRVNISGSSNSSNSKENGPHSMNCFSNENSLNEISKISVSRDGNVFKRLYSSKNSSKRSSENRGALKTDFNEILKTEMNEFENLYSIEEASKKPIPPEISAKYWTVMNAKTSEIVYHKNGRRKREIASLTKMMNLLCVCKLLKEFNIDPKDTYIEVSKKAASMKGTSANLKYGDVLTIWDLLHGMMLPSGNDAALILAESFGTYIYISSDEYKALCEKFPEGQVPEIRNPLMNFLKLMNTTSKELGLQYTNYANPHGLGNQSSYSTANDQALLSLELLKWEMAREIVNTIKYTCNVEQFDKKIRTVTWENTNKLLGREGWLGVKTGVTPSAGPCLSAYYEKDNEAYIVILLSSSSMDIRWLEAPQVVEWALQNKNLGTI